MDDNNDLWVNEKTNAIDSLEVALSLLCNEKEIKWNWVLISIHHSLHTFIIAALFNSDYDNIYENKKFRTRYYTRDSKNWRKAEIAKIPNSEFFRIVWNDVTNEEDMPKFEENEDTRETHEEWMKKYHYENVISFQTAIARIQDKELWMGRYYNQKAVNLDDEQIKQIEYIHNLRNEFMHFKPKLGLYSKSEIIIGLKVYIDTIDFIVFESNSILFLNGRSDIIKKTIKEIRGSFKKQLNILTDQGS